MTYLWHRKGKRSLIVQDQRCNYLFGVVCVTEPKTADLVLPRANQEISRHIKEGNHDVIVFNRARWYTAKKLNILSSMKFLIHVPKKPKVEPCRKCVAVFETELYPKSCF